MKNPWRIERDYGGTWTVDTLVRIWSTVAVAVLAIVVAGIVIHAYLWEAHKTDRGRGDTSVAEVDTKPADAIEMPDTFGNVATKCTYGVRLWVTTNGGIFVSEDPECAAEPS